MPWGSPGAQVARKKQKKTSGPSVGGFVGNLLGDVRDAAVGIPHGVVNLVKNPVESGKAIGKQAWQTWSPLFHGDFEEFGEQTYAHPLAPLLDVSAVLTLGAGGAGRAAVAVSKAGKVSKTSKVGRLAEYSKGGKITFDHPDGEKGLSFAKKTSKNPLHRKRQEYMHELANRLDPHVVRWTGAKTLSKESRYKRIADRDLAGRRAAMMTQVSAFLDAAAKLSGPDKKKYEEKVIRHSYHEMRKFAFEWDPYVRDNRGRKVLDNGKPKMKKLPKGYRVVKEHTPQSEAKLFGRRNTDFGREMENMGGRFTSKNLEAGAKVKGGERVLIVPAHQLSKFGIEAARSHKFIRNLYDKPTAVWKSIILGYRPAFLVNNAVGNHFMYVMGNGGSGAVRAYVDAIRQTKGEKAAARELGQAEKLLTANRRNTGWQDEFFKDQLTNTLASTTITGVARKVGETKLKRRAREGLFGVTHAAADRIVRRAQINQIMRQNPKVQTLMRERGMDFDSAAREVLRRDNGTLRREVAQGVMDVVGDYHSLNKVERAIRQVVPFYTWDRHLARHMAKMVRDRPALMDSLSKVGQMGEEETAKIAGDIPDFLKGAVPLSVLGLHDEHPSRKGLLLTQGLNPYAAVPEGIEALAQAAMGGAETDALATHVNPLLGSVVERATGRSLLTGTPREKDAFGVLLGGPYKDALVNLPQWKLAKTAIGGPESAGKQNPLFKKDFQQYLTSFLGAPTREMSAKRAASLAARDRKRHQAIY